MPVPLAVEAWSPNYLTTSEILVWAALDGPLGTWDLPRLAIEPVSPALTGGFLTTGPPEKF